MSRRRIEGATLRVATTGGGVNTQLLAQCSIAPQSEALLATTLLLELALMGALRPPTKEEGVKRALKRRESS